MKTMLCVMLFVVSLSTLAQAGNVATETIDYAIDKLSQLQPEAQKLGKEYVEYTVWKAHMNLKVSLIIMWIGIGMFVASILFLGFGEQMSNPVLGGIGSALVFVGVIVALVAGAVSISNWYNVQCADKSPLMYTLENSPITQKIVR